MENSTVFYILGSVLAVSAVAATFLGLRMEKFPGRAAPLVFIWFAVLVGATTTFAVLNGQDEQEARASEFAAAGEEFEEAEAEAIATEEKGQAGEEEATGAQEGAAGQAEGGGGERPEGGGEAKPEAGGATTLKLAAEPSEIAFDTTSLSAKAGKVTIDFTNPAPIEHDVAIEEDGKQLVVSDTITEGNTSVSVNLKPGTYTFLCTVPGHAEAGMEGTLTVR